MAPSMRTLLAPTFLAAAFCAQLPPTHAAGASAPLARWVQFTSDGSREERSVYPGDAGGCPEGSSTRAEPSDGFGVRICAATVKGDIAPINRIVVFGDTGCRVKNGDPLQDCARDWPLGDIARAATDKHPDLVIHVGDYLYRENCPNGKELCPGFNYGNTWEAWNDDFFGPVSRSGLLGSAPWIMVRGNHETCTRGGPGWARLIAPEREAPHGCRNAGGTYVNHKPYALHLGDLALVVADSAAGKNAEPLAGQGTDLSPLVGAGTWLLTHKPLTSAKAVSGLWPSATSVPVVVMSGHVHDFGSYNIRDTRISQLIVGTGGTALANPRGFTAGKLTKEFGYLLLERSGTRWAGTFYGLHDAVVARCSIEESRASCAKP